MKKIVMVTVMLVCLNDVQAQTGILEIIKAGVVKVIKAVDLKIQRLQNKVIKMQNAQKVLENKMSELKLGEIGDWVTRQRELYKDYFDELWKVKTAIGNYQRVKDIIAKQMMIVREYTRAYHLSKQDQNFSGDDLQYMGKVYDGIIDEGLKNIEQLQLVINAYATQMSDAKRLEIIHAVGERMDQNLADLRSFNAHNVQLSLQRAKEKNDIDVVKKLYGLQ